mmetsp:Transcript_16154/g.39710  ORF Transcript_16154/g.39710 Transcript_16154/m.39710 type:complete len:283 (-) Transcript_16154:1305-2153(-)
MSVTWTRPCCLLLSCTNTPPPPGATFETVPAIFAPATTWRPAGVRRVTSMRRRAASADRTYAATRCPTANRLVRLFLSAAAVSAVSMRGTRAVSPGAIDTARVSEETAVTTPSITSPSSRVASAATPAIPVPPPSAPPASVAAAAIARASLGVRRAVSSSIDPRSPADPITTTAITAPTATFRRGNPPASAPPPPVASVAWRRPRRPPGNVRIICMGCTSCTTPSNVVPARSCSAPAVAPLPSLRPPPPPTPPSRGTVRRSLPPGDPDAALPATTAATRCSG